MIISVINHTNGKLADSDVQTALRAVNRQISEDFMPYWGFGAQLRLEGKTGKKPDKQALADMRGEAVLYLWDSIDIKDAAGYHEKNFKGISYAFVHVDLSAQLEEPWQVTFSHEALELVGDPQTNLLVQGPHPDPGQHGRLVFHWFEMCDAVQSEIYEIDGVPVSNFVLPLYFTEGEQSGGRNDFLGTINNKKSLRSFGVNPGGYVGFYDPKSDDDETFSFEGDPVAARRIKVKKSARAGRSFRRRERTGLSGKK
jgi:hypothetical protein